MLIKKLVLLAGVICSLFTGSVFAESQSLSVGYTTGYLSAGGYGSHDGHPNGMNFKYRYEFNDKWGVIGAFTFADDVLGEGPALAEWGYTSYMAGPSWRLNDYVSIYYLMGLAHADTHVKASHTTKYKKNAFASSIGAQINPWKNVVLDIGYEYAKFNDYPRSKIDIESGLFIVGVGYRF